MIIKARGWGRENQKILNLEYVFGGAFVFVGYGFSSYGGMYHNAPHNNSFLNGVESYTQPTFQSFQSVIQAFGSVSMMLESTLFAVQNSVRAIVSKFFLPEIFLK